MAATRSDPFAAATASAAASDRAPDPHTMQGGPFDVTGFLDDRDIESERPRLLNPYYAIKPLVPRPAQLALRRVYARRQARRRFPAWPIETLLVDQLQERLWAELDATGAERVPFVNFWPERKRFAFVLTHDVEGTSGVENIPRLLEIERRHGLRSSWNFVAEDYPIDPELFSMLRAARCEIGLHGLHHDGLLFVNRAGFADQLPRIHQVMREWGAVGFRSPATHRKAAWMPELGCLYDSSFPDTDPFEPQPGGCCSIWPFFLRDLVELPITMPQDHTLFEILGESSIRRWVQKSEWVAQNHGLVTVLVHPDYLLSDRRLDLYEQLLVHLTGLSGGWHALPQEVACWWRTRAVLERGGLPVPIDPIAVAGANVRASTAYARREGERIVYDL
jgi:peptidoglycan/xylan/chitin deacetylase (PgdA/CDA1 family)